MPIKASQVGSELFIVDNSDEDWKVRKYLHDWCQISQAIDIATGYFEIGSLLALGDEWKKVDKIRILMGTEVSKRTANAFAKAQKELLPTKLGQLDASLEAEKAIDAFLSGVPAIAEGLRTGRIECRVYKKDKFHAKAYITHARMEVVGSFALVGSSNFTAPGLSQNVELNDTIRWNAPAQGATIDLRPGHFSTLGNPLIYFGGAVYPPEDRYAESDAGDLAEYIRRANA